MALQFFARISLTVDVADDFDRGFELEEVWLNKQQLRETAAINTLRLRVVLGRTSFACAHSETMACSSNLTSFPGRAPRTSKQLSIIASIPTCADSMAFVLAGGNDADTNNASQ